MATRALATAAVKAGPSRPAAPVARPAPFIVHAAPGPLAERLQKGTLKPAVLKPAPVGDQGAAQSQEQTEQARQQAAEAVAAEPAPPEAGADVPDLAGAGAAAQAAPPAVTEADSIAEADQKEEKAAGDEAQAAGEEAKAEEPPKAEKERAPSSPSADPAFQAVLRRGRAVSAAQAHNNTAKRKAAEAQAAALAPADEVQALAGGNQVGKMAEQKPAAFDKESFKAALISQINAIAPGTLEEADEFKSRGTAGELKSAVVGQVEAGKQGAQAPIETTANEAPDPSSVTPKVVEPQPPTEAGAPPPDIGATAAAPKPKTDAEVDISQGPKSIDDRMAEAKVTEDTLANSNEPEFTSALDSKHEAEQHAETAPGLYRAQEAGLVQNAKASAANTAQQETAGMYDSRSAGFNAVQSEQTETSAADTAKREEITARVTSIFEDTKTQVADRLTQLDTDVNTTFDAGAEQSKADFENEVETEKEAYKERRYSGAEGKLLWLKDLILPLPDEVKEIYQAARQHYIDAMGIVIDDVATLVETGLNEAMGLIETGRNSVLEYVSGLDEGLRGIGEEAAAGIQSQFDTLAEEVKNHEKKMVDELAQKYIDNLKGIDALIEQYESEDRGLIGAVTDAIEGVIDTILELKEMLLGILAKAASVIETIIADPIGFLGNLVAGIKAGLGAFLGNIGEHLKNGLMGWLFGAVAEAGIQMPESFDLKGLLSLGAQILGLTYQNVRSRAVRILGEPVVKALETAAEIFKILMTEGIGGVWTYIKDMLGDLTETVLSGIRDWVATKVITAGITWLLSMLNPASAFVRACKMIIDVVMFFIERGSQIMSLVNAILDSIAAIASGAIGAMASAVEGALAKAVPVAISFLASLLGLGGISDVIRKNIEKIQAPVNKAIDWLIQKAVKLVKAVGGLFGAGKKEEEPEDDTADPEKKAKVQAGLAALHQFEQAKLDNGKIKQDEAEEVAATVRRDHPVFRSIVVVEGEGTFDYKYEASPAVIEPGPKADVEQGKVTPYGKDKPDGDDWQSHHVPQKVMARYFGEVYSAAAAAVAASDPVAAARYQGKASDGEAKGTVGNGLSSVWLSSDKHAESHGGQGSGDLKGLAAKLQKSAAAANQTGFDQPIFPEKKDSKEVPSYATRAQTRKGVGLTDAEVAADMRPVFSRVYAGFFTAGYQGVSSALGGNWPDEPKLQPLADKTWASIKDPGP